MKFKAGKCLLRYRLRDAGMSQQELVEKSGVDKSSVSIYVNDDGTARKMTIGTAKSIAHVLDRHIDDLYEWEPSRR